MSDFNRSSSDLIEKINKYIKADGQSFLTTETINFINDEYVKVRERIIYNVNMKVEELYFHNLTTVFNLEKLWDILHKQYVIRKGRKPKISPIDDDVLNTLKCSINEIVEGEKQRCPGIFAFGEPAPTPDFMVGGYKIPENITFEGVRKGRKPSSLKYYSFIDTYHASKLDPMGPIESNINVVNTDVSGQMVPITNSDNVVNVIDTDSVTSESVNVIIDETGLDQNKSVDIINAGSAQNESVSTVVKAGSIQNMSVNVVKPDVIQNPSINEIKKYVNGTILNNNEYCRLGYHINVLKQKDDKKSTIVKGTSKSKSKVLAPFVPQIYRPVEHPPNPKHNPNYGVKKYFMDPKYITYKPIVKPAEKPRCDTFLTVSPHILKSFPPSVPVPKKGRPFGSTNKTAEEKAEIEMNKNPQGRPKGSENKGPTHKTDEDVILKDNEILLRINPNLFEVHMLKYTIDNADKSYSQWIDHANNIVKELHEENKSLTKMYIENWEKVTLEGIKNIWKCYSNKVEMSGRERKREELRERLLNFNAPFAFSFGFKIKDVDETPSLKNSKYIDIESDKVKSAVNDMHSLLRSFKDDKYIGGILRNALKQLNSLDESKLELDEELEWDVRRIDDLSHEESVKSELEEAENNISNIMDSECDSSSSYDVSVGNNNNVKEVNNIMDEEVVCSAPCLIDLINNSVIVNDCNIDGDSSSDTNESLDDSLLEHLEISSSSNFSWGCNVDNDNDIILSIIDDYMSDGESSEDVDVVNVLSDEIYANVYDNIINLMEKPDDMNVRMVMDVNNDYIFDELINNFDIIIDVHDINDNNIYNELADRADIVNNVYNDSVNQGVVNSINNLTLSVYQQLFINHDEIFTHCENLRNRVKQIRNNRDSYFYGSMDKKRNRKQRKVKSNIPLW